MAENSTNTQPPPLPSPPEPQVWELAQFAREILAAARACREGRFGPDKVFIAYAFDELRRQHPSLEMTLDEFKARLTEANHQDLLTLTRADLVQVMNPRDVARSETRYLNAVFHFIRAEAQP